MIFGICGKIASGKSEVMDILEFYDFYCIYADEIVHDLYKKNGLGAKRVEAYFGRQFLKRNGSVDRIKLRELVFEDENKLKLLKDIIHPAVYDEVSSLLKNHKGENIAIESVSFDQDFLGDFVDQLIWVERPEKEILKVLVDERGFLKELAKKAMDLVKKPKNVDLEIRNVGGLDLLDASVMLIL